jgi:hypothetical protein
VTQFLKGFIIFSAILILAACSSDGLRHSKHLSNEVNSNYGKVLAELSIERFHMRLDGQALIFTDTTTPDCIDCTLKVSLPQPFLEQYRLHLYEVKGVLVDDLWRIEIPGASPPALDIEFFQLFQQPLSQFIRDRSS